MMLQDKVIVVLGVGPGVGRSIALAGAREAGLAEGPLLDDIEPALAR